MSTSSQAVVQIGDRPAIRQTLWSEPARLADWAGASGKQYQHLVYRLIECPLAPKANYVLARRDADGRTKILKVGRTSDDAPTLNRAQIRHEAALLGANEVHLHVLAKTETERILIEFDIAATPVASGNIAALATRH
jgi:hypothetical protein